MIITAGYNVGGPEVEDALLKHPAVAECGVIGKPDDERGMIVKAFCVLEARPRRATRRWCKALQDHVKATIAPFKYPREIEFVAGAAPHRDRKAPAIQTEANNIMITSSFNPPGWLPPKGYANGIAARGTQIFVGGQIGWNGSSSSRPTTSSPRRGQALRNIAEVLREAAPGPEHMVRMTWYIDRPRRVQQPPGRAGPGLPRGRWAATSRR